MRRSRAVRADYISGAVILVGGLLVAGIGLSQVPRAWVLIGTAILTLAGLFAGHAVRHDATDRSRVKALWAALGCLVVLVAGIAVYNVELDQGRDDGTGTDTSDEIRQMDRQLADMERQNEDLEARLEGRLRDSGLAITNLRDSQEVPICTPVSGTGTIPPGKDLWIVTKPASADQNLDHWASGLVEESNPDGTWENPLISVGGTDSAGQDFTIYAVLVDTSFISYLQSAGANMWNLLGDPNQEEFVANDLPPHDSTPASVHVTRSNNNVCE